jgi:membrane-associated phospholipid phosphatase
MSPSKGAGTAREFFGLKIRITDVLLLGTTLLFTLLPLIFPSRIKGWLGLVLANGLAVFIYLEANVLEQRSEKRFVKFLLRTGSVQLFLFYIYNISLRLQHVFFAHWNDQAIIDLEQSLFGVQPTIWIQRFITPWLTDWMSFCYVFYVPIYPLLGAIIYYKRGEREMEDYLFYLGVAIILCTIGSTLFPVAGPMRKIGELYDIPLRGYIFTAVGEFIRNHIHVPGGAFPSIHCAAASIMWWIAYRYSRVSFYFLAPVILSLYISTVYGRFHYLIDVIAGIAVALLTMALGHVLIKEWNRVTLKA